MATPESRELLPPIQMFMDMVRRDPHREPVSHRRIEVTVFGQQEYPAELTERTLAEACAHGSKNRLREIVSEMYGPHHAPQAIPHTRDQLLGILVTRYHLGGENARQIATQLSNGEVVSILGFRSGGIGFAGVVKHPGAGEPQATETPYEIMIAVCKNP